jgi:hypothetical protein
MNANKRESIQMEKALAIDFPAIRHERPFAFMRGWKNPDQPRRPYRASVFLMPYPVCAAKSLLHP